MKFWSSVGNKTKPNVPQRWFYHLVQHVPPQIWRFVSDKLFRTLQQLPSAFVYCCTFTRNLAYYGGDKKTFSLWHCCSTHRCTCTSKHRTRPCARVLQMSLSCTCIMWNVHRFCKKRATFCVCVNKMHSLHIIYIKNVRSMMQTHVYLHKWLNKQWQLRGNGSGPRQQINVTKTSVGSSSSKVIYIRRILYTNACG